MASSSGRHEGPALDQPKPRELPRLAGWVTLHTGDQSGGLYSPPRPEADEMMSPNPANECPIDHRRAFLRALQTHDDVVNTEFTRDGFQVIYVEFAPDTGFHASLQEEAHRLGYSIEHLNGAVYRLRQA